ncbi:MAG: AAA family ATPase [Candidatus Mcinerneyibacterium aminivorans]|jgi:type II secretory pathway predicted ATPase ExeA|uniref:AAA family ATPase n=1 Tax=Candidatus Mcinerneyibacterium aminivorans TaxID=2703815 RepID=A0A5D0MKR7_9BACT|nr:MAG: AAA family ATPase [Candidatus Mcinerneyibacterium aminivorans]
MSYENFYDLNEPPFFNNPDERFFYRTPQSEKAILKILHALKRKMGLAVITGNIGSGKTMLSRKLLESLDNRYFVSSLIVMVHSEVSPKWFLKKLLLQFGVETDYEDKKNLLVLLYRKLVKINGEGKIPVVLIDEANMIRNKEFFEEIRGLLNFENKKGKLINFVMFGLPELVENIKMDMPLAQRIAISVSLNPMNKSTTVDYINHRLNVAGADEKIFTDESIDMIYEYSGGIPRIVNTIADNALLEGYIEGKKLIDKKIIDNTVVDLGLVTSAR